MLKIKLLSVNSHVARHSFVAGFTLIEALVVVAIISILVAISLPQYASYRQRAYDLRARSDLRNVATAEEVYFIDNEKYQSCQDQSCVGLPGIARLSSGVTVAIQAAESAFTGQAKHAQGSGKTFVWDSSKGGMQE